MNQAQHVNHFRMDRAVIFCDADPVLPEAEEVRAAFIRGGCPPPVYTETTVCGTAPNGLRVTAVRHAEGWHIGGAGAPRSPDVVASPADLLELSAGLRAARASVHPQTAA